MFISHLVKALLGHAYLTLGASIARSWCVHLTSEQEALFSVFTFLSGADIANAGSVCSLYTRFRHCYITAFASYPVLVLLGGPRGLSFM